MADAYLTIGHIALDPDMQQRLRACATQQAHLGNAPDIENPEAWVQVNSYLWASSPGWAEKWDSALVSHPDDGDPETPPYRPGADPAVITDGDILATVQALGGGDSGRQ